MGPITFDTLEYVKRMRSAGFSESQAEAMAVAQRDSLAQAMDNSVATKGDVVRLESRMDSFESKLEAAEMRLTIKLGAFLAVAVGVLVTLLKH